MSFAPSQLLRPFLPAPANGRWAGKRDEILTTADRIWAGVDEKAIDQRSSLLAFAIRVFSAIIAFVSQVLLARWMGSFEYGVYVWIWVAVVIVGSLSCFGFPAAIVRFIPQYRQSGEVEKLRGVIRASRLFALASSTLLAVLGLAGLWLLGDNVGTVYVWPFFLAAICLPMLALMEIQGGIARAFSWIVTALAPMFVVRPVLILLFFLMAILFGFQPSAGIAMGATIIAVWLTTLFQLLVLAPKISRTVPDGDHHYDTRLWFKVALPIFLIEGFLALLVNVDILIAGLYLSPERVAIYFATVKTLAIVHFVYFAVKAASAPRIAQYFHAGDKAKYQSFIQDTVQWTFWPSVVVGIAILIVGKFLLSLFGPEFVEGHDLLAILVLGIVARASVGPAESVLTMSGKQNACAMIYGSTLLINIVLNLILIPKFGLYGAASATTFALFCEAAALFIAAKKLLGIHLFVLSSRAKTREQH